MFFPASSSNLRTTSWWLNFFSSRALSCVPVQLARPKLPSEVPDPIMTIETSNTPHTAARLLLPEGTQQIRLSSDSRAARSTVGKFVGVPEDLPDKQLDQAAYRSSLWDQSSRSCSQMASEMLISLKSEGSVFFFFFFWLRGSDTVANF